MHHPHLLIYYLRAVWRDIILDFICDWIERVVIYQLFFITYLRFETIEWLDFSPTNVLIAEARNYSLDP